MNVSTIGRRVLLLLILLIVCNAGLPPAHYVGVVTRLYQVEGSAYSISRNHGTQYYVDVSGPESVTCNLTYQAYSKLAEGAKVELHATRVFHNCIEVSVDNSIIDFDPNWRLYWSIPAMILGLILFFSRNGFRRPRP